MGRHIKMGMKTNWGAKQTGENGREEKVRGERM